MALKRVVSHFAVIVCFVLLISGTTRGQVLFDSFSDGNFSANPVWEGITSNWTVVADSDAAAGATGSNTVRLNTPAGGGTQYLSSQISSWGTSQEWGFWMGRRNIIFSDDHRQYFWLYANESNLNSATVDGYRITVGDSSGDDEIILEYIVNGAVSATVITSSGAITNGVMDVGFLVRVTRSSSGAWQLFTSALPTTSGSGAIATAIPNSTNANVNQGSGTNNSLVPSNNGYIGFAALHDPGNASKVGSEFDQIYFTVATAAPTITSANSETFTTGRAGTFTVTTTGNPTSTITRSGTLPAGVTFVDNGNGTGTLSGTPALNTQGSYPLTFTASNGTSPDATQNFTLTVNLIPSSASASISGRALTSSGRGIRNVLIRLTDVNGNVRTATTTSFGYYRFEDVAAGETYIVSATGKRFTFNQQTQILFVNEDTDGINFIANDDNNLIINYR